LTLIALAQQPAIDSIRESGTNVYTLGVGLLEYIYSSGVVRHYSQAYLNNLYGFLKQSMTMHVVLEMMAYYQTHSHPILMEAIIQMEQSLYKYVILLIWVIHPFLPTSGPWWLRKKYVAQRQYDLGTVLD
jgi:hypothetical protein